MFQGQKGMKMLKQNPLQMVFQTFRFYFCAKSNMQRVFRQSTCKNWDLGGGGEVDNLALRKTIPVLKETYNLVWEIIT